MRSELNKNPIEYINYLGVDYEKSGGLTRIICPFHNDTRPSLVIYPDHAYCYACGQGASLPWLASKIKGISYGQALTDLGLEHLPAGQKRALDFFPPKISFCAHPNEIYIKGFTDKHNSCQTIREIMRSPSESMSAAIQWLSDKHLLDGAILLDWRWHDGKIFKRWGEGILIPYCVDGRVVYERFRAYNKASKAFEKPKGPYDVQIQPYYTTFRPNSACFIVEGESDAASVHACGYSAIGVPGSVARKAINSAVAYIADHSFIDTVICCGDKDQAGQRMNQLIREAVLEICPSKKLVTYSVESKKEKADLNDDYVAHLFKPPIEWHSNYGQNYDRQHWANLEFSKFVNDLSQRLAIASARGENPWRAVQS